MRSFFDRLREFWAAAPRNEAFADLHEQLLMTTDVRNYEVRDDAEHGTVIVNVEILRAQEARADERRAMDDLMILTSFPMRCRTILDERQLLDEARVNELWEQWKRIRELSRNGVVLPNGEVRVGDEYAKAVAGGIAVLLRHADWCGQAEDRLPSLVGALRDVLHAPPEHSGLDCDNSASTWTYDCFAAEAVAILWIQEPKSEEWRRAVARTTFALKYGATKLLFLKCAEFRRVLGDDFGRLRRLAFEWAHVRSRVDLVGRVPGDALGIDNETLGRVQRAPWDWIEQRIEAFVTASMPGVSNNWAQFEDVEQFNEFDAVYSKWSSSRGLDFCVVQAAHEWMPLPNEAHDERERGEVIAFWRTALSVVVSRPKGDLNRRGGQYPHEYEQWVLAYVGAVLLQLRTHEEPELILQSVLELHSEGHHWPEALARSLHRQALSAEQLPSTYVGLIRLLVRQAFMDVDGKRRWSFYESVWDTLLGVDGWSRELWGSQHLAVVCELWDVFRFWMDHVQVHGRRLAGFAAWLVRPPAEPLRFSALLWMMGLIRVEQKRELRDVNEAEEAIARLLNVVWTQQESALRAEQDVFEAFRWLLSWLGARQNRFGLELLGRLGNLS
jgi:hypothetical protein